MPLVFKYHDPGDEDEDPAIVDLGDEVVRFGEVSLTQMAAIGEAATSGLDIDDPEGTLDLVGYRMFRVMESSAPSNNQIVWSGRIGDRNIRRGRSLGSNAPFSRVWSMDVIDANWYLSNRLLVDQDAKRPDETAGDRLRWLLNRAGHIHLHDHGHVTYPTDDMDGNDYRLQTAKDVLTDISTQTGYNFWVENNEAHHDRELFFMDPNGESYSSTLRISNDLADVDGTTTFAPGEDAELRRSPVRVAYGVAVSYAKGHVYVTRPTTAAAFAYVDQVAPNANIKKAATARRVGNRFLNEANEEDDHITCSIYVPASQVNDLRAGHRVQAKFTHFPGYESFVWMRVLHRTVVQEAEAWVNGETGEEHYRLDLELSPTGLVGGTTGWLWDSDAGSNEALVFTWDPSNGDIILVLAAKRDGWSGDLTVQTSPSGTSYTKLHDEGDPGIFNDGVAAWYHTSDGTDTQTYIVFPGAGAVHDVVVIGTTGLSSASSAFGEQASTTTPTGPAVTTSGAGIVFGLFCKSGDPGGAGVTLGAGAGWTVLASDNTEMGGSWYHPHTVVVYKTVEEAGTYQPKATCDQSGQWRMISVALE